MVSLLNNAAEPVTSFPVLYCKTATGAISMWEVVAGGKYVTTNWGQLDGVRQQATFACEPKNEGKKNATTAEQQAIKEAEALWKKQIKKKYYQSVEEALGTSRIKPMLAHSYADHKKKLAFPVSCQPKLDGVRCLAYWQDDNVYLQSRGGDPYHMSHIQEELSTYLPKDVILDGELYCHGVSLQNITSLVKKSRPESKKIRYHVYDTEDRTCPGTLTWQEREERLSEFFASWSTRVVIRHPSHLAANEDDVLAAEKDFVGQGYEGAIVRSLQGLYRQGHRSKDLLKVKSFQDAEFKIVGWKSGKGKAENFAIFRCTVSEDGPEFDVICKGTAEERNEMFLKADSLVGQMMKIKYFDLTDAGVPHFPVGLGVRYKEDT